MTRRSTWRALNDDVDGGSAVSPTNPTAAATAATTATTTADGESRDLRTEEVLAKYQHAVKLLHSGGEHAQEARDALSALVMEPLVGRSVRQAKTTTAADDDDDGEDAINAISASSRQLAYAILKQYASIEHSLKHYLDALVLDHRDPSLWHAIGRCLLDDGEHCQLALAARAFESGWHQAHEYVEPLLPGAACLRGLVECEFLLGEDDERCLKHARVLARIDDDDFVHDLITLLEARITGHQPIPQSVDYLLNERTAYLEEKRLANVQSAPVPPPEERLIVLDDFNLYDLLKEFRDAASDIDTGKLLTRHRVSFEVPPTPDEPEPVGIVEILDSADEVDDRPGDPEARNSSGSDFEEPAKPTRASGRMRTQRRLSSSVQLTNNASSSSAQRSGKVTITLKDLLKQKIDDESVLAEEMDRYLTKHSYKFSAFDFGRYLSDGGELSWTSFQSAVMRCFYVAAELTQPQPKTKRRQPRNTDTSAEQTTPHTDPLEERWENMLKQCVKVHADKERALHAVFEQVGAGKGSLVEVCVHTIKVLLDSSLSTSFMPLIIELLRLLLCRGFFQGDLSQILKGYARRMTSMDFHLQLAEMNVVMLKRLLKEDPEGVERSLICHDLRQLFFQLIAPVRRWGVEEALEAEVGIPACKMNWLSFEMDRVFDEPLDEQRELLNACSSAIASCNLLVRLDLLDVDISSSMLDNELKNLSAEHELSAIFHSFENLQSYERVMAHLEPVLLGEHTGNSRATTLNRRVLSRQPYVRRVALYNMLYDSADKSGEHTKAARCALAMMHMHLVELARVDGLRELLVDQWDEVVSKNLGDYAEELTVLARLVFAQLMEVWVLLRRIVQKHAGHLTALPSSDRRTFFFDAAFCMKLAYAVGEYSDEIDVALGKILPAKHANPLPVELPPDVASLETYQMIQGVTRWSVSAWIAFYEVIRRLPDGRSSAPLDIDQGDVGTPLEFLILAHDEVGDQGLCKEFGAALLVALEAEILQWYREHRHISHTAADDANALALPTLKMNSRRLLDNFSQCWSCLYDLSMPTFTRGLAQHSPEHHDDHERSMPSLAPEVATAIFQHALVPFLRVLDKETDVARCHDVFTKLDELFNPKREELRAIVSAIGRNESALTSLLEHRHLAPEDLTTVVTGGKFPFTMVDLALTHPGNELVKFFKVYYHEKAMFHLKYGYLDEDNSLPKTIAALHDDLVFNPASANSWYDLAMCYVEQFKEALDDEVDMFDVVRAQQSGFWCLRQALALCDGASGHDAAVDGLSAEQYWRRMTRVCKALCMSLSGYSELGHLAYSMACPPSAGFALLPARLPQQHLDRRFFPDASAQPFSPRKRSRPLSESNSPIAQGMDVDPSGTVRVTHNHGMAAFEIGQAVVDDLVKRFRGQSMQDRLKELLTLPPTKMATANTVPQSEKRRLFAFAGACFTQCRRQLARLNGMRRAMFDAIQQRQWQSVLGDKMKEFLLAREDHVKIEDNWEWLVMLAKCSVKLGGRPKEQVAAHYQRAAECARHSSFFRFAKQVSWVPDSELSYFSRENQRAMRHLAAEVVVHYAWLKFVSEQFFYSPLGGLEWVGAEVKRLEAVITASRNIDDSEQLPLDDGDGDDVDSNAAHHHPCADAIDRLSRMWLSLINQAPNYHPSRHAYAKFLLRLTQDPQLRPLLLADRRWFTDRALLHLEHLFHGKTQLVDIEPVPCSRPAHVRVCAHRYSMLYVDLLTPKNNMDALFVLVKRARSSGMLWPFEVARKAFIPYVADVELKVRRLLPISTPWWMFVKKLPKLPFQKTVNIMETHLMNGVKELIASAGGDGNDGENPREVVALFEEFFPDLERPPLLEVVELYRHVADGVRRAASDAFRSVDNTKYDMQLTHTLQKVDDLAVELYSVLYVVFGLVDGVAKERVQRQRLAAAKEAASQVMIGAGGEIIRAAPVPSAITSSSSASGAPTSILSRRIEQHLDTILLCFQAALSGFAIDWPNPPLETKKPSLHLDETGAVGGGGASGAVSIDEATLVYRAGAVAKHIKPTSKLMATQQQQQQQQATRNASLGGNNAGRADDDDKSVASD